MKKIITLTALVFAFITTASAQGNLQFNQVTTGSFTAINLPYVSTTIGTITVPAGKVWKIESTNYTYVQGSNTWPIGSNSYVVMIDDHMAYCQSSGQPQHYLPLWLPAGTYNVTALAWDVDVTFSYSAIEFNIVP